MRISRGYLVEAIYACGTKLKPPSLQMNPMSRNTFDPARLPPWQGRKARSLLVGGLPSPERGNRVSLATSSLCLAWAESVPGWLSVPGLCCSGAVAAVGRHAVPPRSHHHRHSCYPFHHLTHSLTPSHSHPLSSSSNSSLTTPLVPFGSFLCFIFPLSPSRLVSAHTLSLDSLTTHLIHTQHVRRDWYRKVRTQPSTHALLPRLARCGYGCDVSEDDS